MPTLEEIVERYQNYSDEELIDVYNQIDGYTEEGKEALKIVVNKRGGIESLKDNLTKQIEIDNETSKIKLEVLKLLTEGKNTREIKNIIELKHVTENQLEKIVEETITEIEKEKPDKEIKPRTIIGSIIGGAIGGTIGGIIWGVQMVFSNHMFLILVIGLAMLSYAFIWLFTRQSKRNTIVLVMTVLSVIYALILGQIIFEIFGYIK